MTELATPRGWHYPIQDRFIPLLRAGKKETTVRLDRRTGDRKFNDRLLPQFGDKIHFIRADTWRKKGVKWETVFSSRISRRTKEIFFALSEYDAYVHVDGEILKDVYASQVYYRDGFSSLFEMRDFLLALYPNRADRHNGYTYLRMLQISFEPAS